MYSLDNVLGNEFIIESLKNAIKTERVTQSYIFSGLKGLGKRLTAYSFAKVLQCHNNINSGDVCCCCKCISCITFESGNNTDVFFVESTKTKSIGVDDIREQIKNRMDSLPYTHKYKIFIVSDADKMSVAAQNALLKTIEEPAGYGIFIFLTENFKSLLPTIISRSVVYKLKPLSYDTVYDYLLKGQYAEAETAGFVAAYSEGNLGRALELVSDEEFIEMRNCFAEIARGIELSRKNESDKNSASEFNIFSAAKSIESFKDRIQEGLNILLGFYRDLLVAKVGGSGFLFQSYSGFDIRDSITKVELKTILKRLSVVLDAKRQLMYYANFNLTIEVMLMRLAD